MRVNYFTARYPSDCRECGERILEGDEACFIGSYSGAHCAECGDYYTVEVDDD